MTGSGENPVPSVSYLLPRGGTSNSVLFDIAAPGQNPAPSITAIQPWQTIARGAASITLTVQVLGENFSLESQGQWNGQNQPTQVVSESELWLTLNSLDIAFGGSGAVTVVDRESGAASNPEAFTIYPYAVYMTLSIK